MRTGGVRVVRSRCSRRIRKTGILRSVDSNYHMFSSRTVISICLLYVSAVGEEYVSYVLIPDEGSVDV